MPAAVDQEWDEIVRDYRAAAERLGFRLLERSISESDGGYTCTDFLLNDSGTFLDLTAFIVRGRPPNGVMTGFLGAALTTWLDNAGRLDMFLQWGEPQPPPQPRGFAALIVKRILGPLFERMVPETYRPQPLRGPEDLAPLLERHRQDVRHRPGRVVEPGADPLEQRWELVRRLDEQADAEKTR